MSTIDKLLVAINIIRCWQQYLIPNIMSKFIHSLKSFFCFKFENKSCDIDDSRTPNSNTNSSRACIMES
jgi:hypothetical protein